MNNRKTRVVITGLGIVSPIGVGKKQFWDSLYNMRTNFSNVKFKRKYKVNVGGIVNDDEIRKYITKDEIRKLDKCSLYGYIATKLALEDSKIDNEKISETGMIFATTSGGWSLWEAFYKRYIEDGDICSNFNYSNTLYSTPIDNISKLCNIQGMKMTISSACASSNMSIAYAYDAIRLGREEVILAGGADALSEIPYSIFNSLRILSKDLCRPFSKEPSGLILSEGSAVLVLESLEHALKRNAHIYAEVIGTGLSCDAFHMTRSNSNGLCNAIEDAISNAKILKSDIDYINCHGTGTASNDYNEAKALNKTFSNRKIPINSIKSFTGHMQGTAGAAEIVATCMIMEKKSIPPIINVNETISDFELDFVLKEHRKQNVNIAISNSLGFGGVNSTIILEKYKLDRNSYSNREKIKHHSKKIVVTGFDCNIIKDNKSSEFRNGDIFNEGSTNLKDTSSYDKLIQTIINCIINALGDFENLRNYVDRRKMAVCLETVYGSQVITEKIYETIIKKGPNYVKPSDGVKNTFNSVGTLIAKELGFEGSNATFAISKNSANDALIYGYDLIKSGKADIVICGGYDQITKYISDINNNRDNINFTEEVGIVILESIDSAIKRQAKIYGEIIACETKNNNEITYNRIVEKFSDVISRLPNEKNNIGVIFSNNNSEICDMAEKVAIKNCINTKKDFKLVNLNKKLGNLSGTRGILSVIYSILYNYTVDTSEKKYTDTILLNSININGNISSVLFKRF